MAKMFIIDSIMLDLKNFIVATLNTIVVFLFGIHMVSFEFYFDIPYMVQEAQKMAIMSTVGILFMIFFRIIHFVIILFISVPVGGVLLMLYVLFTSFFGIFAYSGFNPKEIINKIIEINKFTSFKSKDHVSECDEPSIFDRFIRIINYVSDFFYKYCFWIAFLYMLIYASVDYWQNIKAPLLKTSLLCINSMLILLFSVLCYTSYKDKNNKDSNIDKPGKPDKPTNVNEKIYKEKVDKIIEEARKPSHPISQPSVSPQNDINSATVPFQENIKLATAVPFIDDINSATAPLQELQTQMNDNSISQK
jgi:hypothetical protein